MKKKIISFLSLIVSDLITLFTCFCIAYVIRTFLFPQIFYKFKTMNTLPFSNYLTNFYIAFIWIFIFAYEKLYTKRYYFWQEVYVLIKSATISSALIMIMIFITRKQVQFSRVVVLLAWFLSLFLFPLSRYFIKTLLIRLNYWKKQLIILGVHETSLMILDSIRKNKSTGYEILGFLDNDPQKIGKVFNGVKVLGPISKLERIAKDYKSKDIMIATPHLPRKKLKELLATCEELSESMWLIPRSGDFITEGVDVEVLGQVLTLSIKKNLAKPWNILIKNIFEKVITLIFLIFLIPVFLIIAIAIAIDSRGPIFYIQKRVGRYNKIFNFYKFRSMYHNSEKKLIEYLEENPDKKEEWEKYKKLKNSDPRVTRFGKFLRRYSLDELPQLLNVITGKMSIVGPRPYLLKELKDKEKFKNSIAKVKPGITGLWQISGRSDLPFEERLALDNYYIRNWSLWLDIVILLKTLKVFFSSQGAY